MQIPRSQDKAVDVRSLPDTGAQLTVTGIKLIHSLGIKKSELIPLSHGVSAANNAGLSLIGGAFITFKGVNSADGVARETKQLCYVASVVEGVYLSKTACIDLGLIHEDFPEVGTFGSLKAGSFIPNKLCNNKDAKEYQSFNTDQSRPCNCPHRELPPPAPTELPFPATDSNREKLKKSGS